MKKKNLFKIIAIVIFCLALLINIKITLDGPIRIGNEEAFAIVTNTTSSSSATTYSGWLWTKVDRDIDCGVISWTTTSYFNAYGKLIGSYTVYDSGQIEGTALFYYSYSRTHYGSVNIGILTQRLCPDGWVFCSEDINPCSKI